LIIDARSIGDPQYAQSVAPGEIASDVAVTSSSTAGVTLSGSAADTTLRSTFGRVMATSSFSDVSVQATLDDHASRLSDDLAGPVHQITPGLLAVPGFEWGDLDVGDVVTYEYDAGLGLQTFTPRVRVLQLEVDTGIERMSIGFY